MVLLFSIKNMGLTRFRQAMVWYDKHVE